MLRTALAAHFSLGIVVPWVAENHPLSPLSRFLPTPHELRTEMNLRMLKNLRELLQEAEKTRKHFEGLTDGDYSEGIAILRKNEEDMKRWIERLENELAAPRPPAPLPRIPRPKPPVRD